MYERSAIVLERYMEEVLNLNKLNNLKKNSENYTELISEVEDYQIMTQREQKVIQEFDETVKTIENIQAQQEKIYNVNKKLEEERAILFRDLGENTKLLESKLKKIENLLEKNNEDLKILREEFIKNLSDFSQKQKDRNKGEKAKRLGEARHIEYIKKIQEEFNQIDLNDVSSMKTFISSEKEEIKKKALEIMIKNGKNEKVAFNQEVLKKAISNRIDIAEKEAECYLQIFDKTKKLLSEPDLEVAKLNKYQKTQKDTSVKLAFLREEKEYIVSFLDYERMTAIGGTRAHNKMMKEACKNFDLDTKQIRNLYELILKEIASKATKKSYKELYNKTYLRNIEDKEKNFEKEANQVNISMGTVINSNYWRIEGIKNIYNVFQKEVSEKFEKDLSEYRIDDIEEYEIIETDEYDDEDQYYEDDEYEEDDEYDDEDEEDEYDEDEEDEYDEDDEDDEYNDEDDEDEYDDEYDEEDDDEYDDEDDDEYDDEDEDEYDEEEDDEYDEEDDVVGKVEIKKRKNRNKRKTDKKNNNSSNNKGLFDKLFKK